jgi:hypothetical protein
MTVDDVNNSNLWSFLAEGKMHVVVSNSSHSTRPIILRIPKHTAISNSNDQLFVLNLMIPWYSSSSISMSSVIELSNTFIESLTNQIDSFRPLNRKIVSEPLCLKHHAHIEFNYNYVHKGLPRLSNIFQLKTSVGEHSDTLLILNGCHISFDFKVKCGLLGSSPFIPSSRGLKLGNSKFRLMQLYKLAKKTKSIACTAPLRNASGEPAWGTFHTVSHYNPSDLCSMDKDKIMTALNALVDNPQNNLRVCLNGRHVFGWDKDKATAVDLTAVCCQFLGDTSSADDASLRRTLDLLTAVLSAEQTLSRLEQMQAMDLLDVEGAALVFQRLVDLSGGDVDAAERLINVALESPMDDGIQISIAHCLSSSGYGNCELCPSVVVSLAALRISASTPEHIADQYRLSAHSLLAEMTKSDCLLLLTLWMMGLVAKDASVIVALQRVCGMPSDRAVNIDKSSVQMQTETTAGLVIKSYDDMSDSSDVCVFAYCLSLVDIGPKSVDKIWKKGLEEQELYLRYEEGIEMMSGRSTK